MVCRHPVTARSLNPRSGNLRQQTPSFEKSTPPSSASPTGESASTLREDKPPPIPAPSQNCFLREGTPRRAPAKSRRAETPEEPSQSIFPRRSRRRLAAQVL